MSVIHVLAIALMVPMHNLLDALPIAPLELMQILLQICVLVLALMSLIMQIQLQISALSSAQLGIILATDIVVHLVQAYILLIISHGRVLLNVL
jgi:hypothetical protein